MMTSHQIPSCHFLGGNHDYWVGDFFSRELGVRVHKKEIPIEAQGKRFVLAHGDLVMPREREYMAKTELFQIPGFGALIRALNAHPVDRSGSDSTALRLALRLLDHGGGG